VLRRVTLAAAGVLPAGSVLELFVWFVTLIAAGDGH
jgi:hypothetical protein